LVMYLTIVIVALACAWPASQGASPRTHAPSGDRKSGIARKCAVVESDGFRSNA